MLYPKMLGNDLVINENNCNQACAYCLTSESQFKKGHLEKRIFKKPTREVYHPDSKLGRQLHKIIERFDKQFKAPFIKISGGEVFLIKRVIDFISWLSKTHDVVVVQSNGLLLKEEIIHQLESMNNVVIQLSMDSCEFRGNSYRAQNHKHHEIVMKRLDSLTKSKLPIEIYGVLHDRSIEDIQVFSEWLNRYDADIVYFPYPVRGPNAEKFKVQPFQWKAIEGLIANYDRYARILPPRRYLEKLLNFYEEGKRNFSCHLPRLVASTFNDGILTACPNIWMINLGNILSSEWQQILETVGDMKVYALLLAKTPRLKECHHCFTPWDVLSLYIEDEISVEELHRSPTYRHALVTGRINEVKAAYQSRS